MRLATISATALLLAALAIPAAALEPNTCQALTAWAANLEKLPTGYEAPGLRGDPGGCQIRLSGCGMFYEEVCDGQCYYL